MMLDCCVASGHPQHASIIFLGRSRAGGERTGENVLYEVGRNVAIADALANERLQLAMISQKQGTDLLAPTRHFDLKGEPTGTMK
jgi:hypothetical protein